MKASISDQKLRGAYYTPPPLRTFSPTGRFSPPTLAFWNQVAGMATFWELQLTR